MITTKETFPLINYVLFDDNQNELGEAIVELRNDRTAYIQRITIIPEEHGKGHGAALLSKVLEDLKSRNIWHVSAYINNYNTISKNMFTKFDFLKEESDEWCATYGDYMGKRL